MTTRLLATTILFCALVQAATLENAHVLFRFSDTTGSLTEVMHKQTGRAIPLKGECPLWRLSLLSEDGGAAKREVVAQSAPQISAERQGETQIMTLRWTQEACDVTMTVALPDASGIAEWRIKAETHSAGGQSAPWIRELLFPCLDTLGSLGDDKVIYGQYLGRQVRLPSTRMSSVKISSPGDWAMQFLAFFGSAKSGIATSQAGSSCLDGFQRAEQEDETGLFLATDDGEGYHKELRMEPGGGVFSARVAHYPEFPFWPLAAGVRPADFSYTMPYPVQMGAFHGGQGEAVELYRRFALEHANVKAAGPLSQAGNTVADRLKDNVFWGKIYYGADKVTPEVLAMRDYLNVPMCVHWYRFNVNVFDDNNINYFPTHNHFREGVEAMKRAGIGVAPYVCCAVADPDTESYARWHLDEGRTLDESLKPYIWVLCHQPSFYMNPASQEWRDGYRKVTEKLFGQWGTDGQYLDCTASLGLLDYSGKHNKPHGGNYWVQGNRRLLEELHSSTAKLTERPFLISEGFNENYIGSMDSFLMLDITRYGWALNRIHEVIPLMSQVYHDYVIPYGSDCNQQQENLDEFRWNMALSFAWGIQLCYSTRCIETPGSKPHDAYTRDLAQAWYCVANKFLNGGRWLPLAQIPQGHDKGVSAAVLETGVQKVEAKFDFSQQEWNGPAVVGSLWQAADSTLGVTMANLTDKAQPATLTLRQAKLPAGLGDVIWQSWPLPAKRLGKLRKETQLDLKVPANGCLVLEIRDASAPEVRPLPSIAHRNFLADAEGGFQPQEYAGEVIYGCDAGWILHKQGQLTLCATPDGEPLRARPFNWRTAEGNGGPRHALDRTFYVAKPSSCRLTEGQGTWSARLVGDVLSLSLTLESADGVLATGDDRAIFYAVNVENGEIINASQGKLKLNRGKYRVVSYHQATGWQRFQSGVSLLRLANLSRQTAAVGAKLLQGEDSLHAIARRQGERLLALGNAAAWSVTGEIASCLRDEPHDQIMLGCADEWAFSPAGGALRLLNDNRQDTVRIDAADKGFSLLVDDIDAAQTLLRVLYQADKDINGEKFTLTALKYLEVIEPIIPEISYKEEQIVKGDMEDQVSVTLEVTNVSPFAVPITVSATSLPTGWHFPKDKNECRYEMEPRSRKVQKLFFQHDGTVPQASVQTFEIGVNYSDKALTLLHEQFMVINRNTKVAALNPQAQRPAQPTWTGGTRDEVLVAFPAGVQEQQVSLEFRPHDMGDRTIKSLKCIVLDRKLRPVREVTVSFDGLKPASATFELPQGEPLMVRVEGAFFQMRVHAAQYGCSAWKDTRFHMFARQKTTFYFQVSPGAKEVLLGMQDGGPLEIATVTVRDSEGKEVFSHRGNAAEGEPTRIPVANGQDGKIWSITLEPVEDFFFWLEAGASPWVSLDQDCVIKEIQ